MSDLNSIHLQNYPDVSNISVDTDLVNEMDLVKEICSVALFLRDKENLRVRLPLNQIKIISNDIENLKKYQDIIADEINVKNVVFEEDIDKIATYILQVDLKKLGANQKSLIFTESVETQKYLYDFQPAILFSAVPQTAGSSGKIKMAK